MSDVATVNNDVVDPRPQTKKKSSGGPGFKVLDRIMTKANEKEGFAQTIYFLAGVFIAIPLLAFDLALLLAHLMIWLNHKSRALAWTVEKTGVLFPVMALVILSSVVTLTYAPAKVIRTEIVRTIQGAPAPTPDDGAAEGNSQGGQRHP